MLVNNAGITRDNIILRMSDEEWSDIMNVHLYGTFQLSKRALKMMLKNKWGRIINISSASASIGNRGQSNYAAAKAGVDNIMKGLTVEWSKYGMRFVGIAPGPIADTGGASKLDGGVQVVGLFSVSLDWLARGVFILSFSICYNFHSSSYVCPIHFCLR